MSLSWSKDLETGIELIDNQHKEMFRQVKIFLDAVQQKKSDDEVFKLVKFLESYIIDHFKTEEEYMEKYDYSGTPYHKKEHQIFSETVTNLVKKVETEGPRIDVIIEATRTSGSWLINHIQKVDKAMAKFLKSKM